MTPDTIEAHRVETDDGLFDSSQYDLPIPKKDGHRADVLRISLGGSIELDLYNEDDLAFIQALKLGQELELTVTVRVASAGWTHALKGEEHEDHAVYAVGVKAHSIDIPPRDI